MNTKSIIKNVIITNKRLLITLISIMVVSIALRIATPLILRNLLNDIVIDGAIKTSKLVLFSCMAIAFTLFTFFLDTQRIAQTITLGLDITSNLNQKAFSTVLHSELQEMKKADNEEIIDKIKNKAGVIGNQYIARNVVPFIYELTLCIALNITLLAVNYWFFLLTLLALPIYYFVSTQVDDMIKKREEKAKRSEENHVKFLGESLKQVKNTKLLNGINLEEDKNAKLLKKIERSYIKDNSLKLVKNEVLNSLFLDIVFACFVWIGGYLITRTNNYKIVGSLIAVMFFIPQILRSVRRLIGIMVFPQNVEKEIEALDEIFNLRPENRAESIQQLDEIYSIKFKDVAFDYEKNGKFNLENINFEIKKGEKLGILGLSNRGKTTVADLLTKIIRPKQGSILINNCDLNKINSYYLRELIAVVPQEFKLIRGTIENNITYPLPFDEYKYNDALNKCRLKQVLANIDKRDQAMVSDDTDILTVAEKQKIALANAFYKDAKIFLLDEATSKLDQTSENEIMNEIYKLKNKVIIVISNRIYNLSKCDKILILNNGRIVEYGKTSELLADSHTTFARMMDEYEQTKIRVS